MSRKIFNYESVILREETFKEFGYYPEKYGEKSAKFVIAVCRFCGEKMQIRKGFFNKSGSACHKGCKNKELKQQKSPFSDPLIRAKSQKTIEKKYGKDRKKIGEKISTTRMTAKSKEKTKKTNLEKYGVENVFQAESVKEKTRETNLEKYGFEHHMKNEEMKEKFRQTNLKKYGVDNPMKDENIKNKARKKWKLKYSNNEEFKKNKVNKFKKSIQNNKHYNLINTLRGEYFWDCLSEGNNLKYACENFNLNYGSLTFRLLDKEFVDKYYAIYTFPNIQKQKEIYNELKEYNIKCELNTRQIISPLELDIYLPDYNFAIEFNGNVWHSEYMIKDLKEAKYKHLNKTKLCEEKGIRLFHIFEHQWDNRKDQILNFIKTILGLNEINIPARKCLLDNSDAKDFIDNYHIQGSTHHVLKYFNLVYDGEIVASLTASKHHRQNVNQNDVVLSRLCFKNNTNVQGGSSKLFKYFKIWAKEQGYDNIISWSDNCWTQGNIYNVLNFELEKEYYPDYFYYNVKTHEVKSKQSQRKSATGCPKDIEERDWCIKNNLYRIWDCGKKKWIINIEKGI